MTWSERDNDGLSAPASHFAGSDDRFFRVIAAFDYHIRFELLHQIQRRILREDNYEIDAFQRSENIRPFCIAAHRSRRTFESADRFITVDPDDECVGGLACSREHVDVAGMEEVENAVGESYSPLLCGPPAQSIDPRRHLRRRIAWLQSLLTATG